ncbi:MAG: hypothetical protein Salg2KO_18960 [Salibacteraceae bacterium]
MHRVNSIEKLNEVKNSYAGVETDVVFIDGIFDVNHPPQESIGLRLEQFLSHWQGSEERSLWLDFKNLDLNNANTSADRLNSICNDLGIDNRKIVVESNNPEALTAFSQLNFQVSYYVPSGMYALDSLALVSRVSDIYKKVENHPELYLSSNYKDYPTLKKFFPDRKLLHWHTGGRKSLSQAESDQIIADIMEDSQVLVLLKQVKSEFDR